jgi:propanol-preferring alcohol dehydrogenase
MRAMLLDEPGKPLRLAQLPVPRPDAGELLIHVHACGVCRTDLHVLDAAIVFAPDIPSFPYADLWGAAVLRL